MQLENVQPRSQNMDVRSPVATAQAGDQYERYEPSAEFPAYVPRFAKPRDYASSGEWPTISVIIPTLNEVQNLPLVLAELPADIFEIIVVDGHSTDGTVETARRVCPRVNIVLQTGKGKGDALRCGFEAARGDIIVMLDADGSADPAEIADFVEVLLAGADFAKGTRFRTGGGSADITPLRRLGNHGLSKTVNLLFGTRYTDLCYGYNAFWSHCLPVLDVDCSGFEIETLINIRIRRAGLDVREVPSFERERIHGQSNLRTFRDGSRVLRTIVAERLRRSPRSKHASRGPRLLLTDRAMELAAEESGA